MDQQYQTLISSLSGRQNLILTSLLSSQDFATWEESKLLIISHMPFLTLEMAVNRVCQRAPNSIPTPSEIYAALEYANTKRRQYLRAPPEINLE